MFVSIYFLMNIVLSVAAAIGLVVSKIGKNGYFRLAPSQILRAHYFLLGISVLCLLCVDFVPEASFESPVAQKFNSLMIDSKVAIESSVQKASSSEVVASIDLQRVFSLIIFLMIIFKFLKLTLSSWQTFKKTTSGFLYKKVGNLKVYMSENFSTPYAYSFGRKSFVSVPVHLLSDPKNFKITLTHELQHIRSRDTSVMFLLEGLRIIFFLNPIVRLWVNIIILEQEFSCDEALLKKKGISPQDYACCLYEVAQQQSVSDMQMVGATGIMFASTKPQLSRRILKMSHVYKKVGRMPVFSFLLVSISLISFAAYSSYAGNSYGSWSVNSLQGVVNEKDFSEDFPVVINEQVVKQLNRFTRTKKGRAYVDEAMENFEKHKLKLKKHVVGYNYPKELLAIPFIESQYKNLPAHRNPNGASGIWQFIAPTAKAYNLINESGDHRRNIEMQSDAAMRYLGASRLRFQDWGLSVLAYNAGGSLVQKGINKTKSRDPWVLIENGFENDRNYLAKVMAAVLILKYPILRN